ncbi:hypothetical protein SDC9_75835 [bioreactor metagenome]|jgi:hypothetical protein|uniref:Mycothiol-dependent maleylpyruvate isomerase metal-binding domain-containing protein n=1 Tax=bioreactor metagenome TaxID=1076179 RepID=A0A644YL27_9ZZZZ
MIPDLARINLEIDRTHKNVLEFITVCNSENSKSSSYEDWSYKDVIAHLTRWISFSADKLESIKNQIPFKDVDDFRKTNREWYAVDYNKELKIVESEFEKAIKKYKAVIVTYGKEELIKNDLPLGFGIDLWRYMIMDGSTHPNGHLLYHYLKRRKYLNFIKVMEETKDIFYLFSNGNSKVYSFVEYKDKAGMVKNRLEELSKAYNDNDILKKVMEANQ